MGVPLARAILYDRTVEERGQHSEADAAGLDSMVARARAGDRDAFDGLVRRFRNEVFALAYHFVRNREEAWDISQEVFIKAYRSLKRFRGDAGFKTWLMRITANHCKDQFKKRRLATVRYDGQVGREPASPSATPDRALEAAELGRAIETAVDALPPKQRMAFVLREYQGLAYQEMAEVMKCNIGTVMSRLHHARRRLQNTLTMMGVMEGK